MIHGTKVQRQADVSVLTMVVNAAQLGCEPPL